jgi:hypothetical protein
MFLREHIEATIVEEATLRLPALLEEHTTGSEFEVLCSEWTATSAPLSALAGIEWNELDDVAD